MMSRPLAPCVCIVKASIIAITRFGGNDMPYTSEGVGYIEAETSKAAAESLDAGSLRARVLAAIAESGRDGITCDEVEIVLSMSHQTASARITELFLRNKIHRRGKRRTRSGRSAWVYRIGKES